METTPQPDRSDQPTALPSRLAAALARAQATEAMYRDLVGRLPAITYTEALDDGRTLSISPQVESLLGCSQDEWMVDPLLWVALIHPEDREWVVESCRESNRKEEPFRAEYRMIARDGRVVWFRDEAEIVRGSAGQRLCWQGVMFDITAQKEAENGLGPTGDTQA
jgi:PAS domain S-box-containing protein